MSRSFDHGLDARALDYVMGNLSSFLRPILSNLFELILDFWGTPKNTSKYIANLYTNVDVYFHIHVICIFHEGEVNFPLYSML